VLLYTFEALRVYESSLSRLLLTLQSAKYNQIMIFLSHRESNIEKTITLFFKICLLQMFKYVAILKYIRYLGEP